MNSKPIYKSKTFWINTITALVSAFVLFTDSGFFEIPDAVATLFLSFTNIVLRVLTGQPISIPGIEVQTQQEVIIEAPAKKATIKAKSK